MTRKAARKRKPTPSRKKRAAAKTKRAKKAAPALWPWVVGGIALAVLVVGVGWKLGLGPELRKPPLESELPAPLEPILGSTALEDSLTLALIDLGLQAGDIRRAEGSEGSDCWEWAVDLPSGYDLVRTNLMLTQAVERWGGRIWHAEEFRSLRTGGLSIRMDLGSRAEVLGRLLLEGSRESPKPIPSGPRLAIVIDDFGYFLGSVVDGFVEFPYPLTLSILPSTPHAGEIYKRARQSGQSTILHLPMEPHGYPRENPGPNSILIDMSEKEILETFRRSLAELPGVGGFSNHMGSAATEDVLVMRTLLTDAARRGLFFFDSLTSPRSVGSREAARCGVPCATNDLFIDNDPDDLETIRTMIRRLGEKAKARGWAVGIGHPNQSTLDVLKEDLPQLEAEGVTIVPVSDLARVRIAHLDRGSGAREAKGEGRPG